MNELLNTVLAVCAVPLAGLLAALILKLRTKLDGQATAQDRANMEGEIAAVLKAGAALVAKVSPDIAKNGINDPIVRQQVLDAATAYMRQRFPDRTAQIAEAVADTGTRVEDVNAAVQQTLNARLTNVIQTAPAVAALLPALGSVYPLPANTLPTIPR